MPGSDVEIRLRITEQGLEIVDKAGVKFQEFNKSASSVTEAGGGFANFTKGMTDAKGAWDIFSGAITQSWGMIDNVNQIGVASLRAKAGFEQLGGTADTIERMQAATHGLADDTDLLHAASLAMSSGMAKSADDLVQIAEIGATLGITFRGDATTGVMEFTRAIESVGNVRSLRGLGIDVQAVKLKLDDLKGTMSDADAWRMAVLSVAGENAKKLAGQLDGTGTSLERVKIRFEDLAETMSERVAVGLENVLKWWDLLRENPSLTLALTIHAIGEEVITGGPSAAPDYNPRTQQFQGAQAHYAYEGSLEAHYYTDQISAEKFEQEWGMKDRRFKAEYGTGSQGGLQFITKMSERAKAAQEALDAMEAILNSPSRFSATRHGETSAERVGRMGGYFDEIPKPPEDMVNRTAAIHQLRGFFSAISDLGDEVSEAVKKADQQRTIREQVAHNQALKKLYDGEAGTSYFSQMGPSAQVQEQQAFYQKFGHASELGVAREAWGQIVGLAGQYNDKLQSALAPLAEQQRILEKRKAIQSVDDAFGIGPRDGLYAEMGGSYQTVMEQQRAQMEQQLARKYGRGSKKFAAGMEAFDDSAKDAYGDWLVQTGQATRESLLFRDAMSQLNDQAGKGKLSMAQYTAALAGLSEMAKSGKVGMADLYVEMMNIAVKSKDLKQVWDIQAEYRLKGGGSDSDEEMGAGIDNPDGPRKTGGRKKTENPFQPAETGAEKAEKAAQKFGASAATAVGGVAVAATLAATQMGGFASQAQQAGDKVSALKQALNALVSLNISITAVNGGGGGGRGDGEVGSGTRGPR